MIHFERSKDYALIRGILTHEKIWPHISDDGSPAREEYRPVEHDAMWYVIVRDADELLGLWMFCPESRATWIVHTALLPAAWGPRGQLAARMLPEWIWANTPCRRIITSVPSMNRLALHFAMKAGMTIFGINQASYLKNGVYCDQVCLGISPPEILAGREAEIRLPKSLRSGCLSI